MGLVSFIMDLYENTRKTSTNVKSSKPKERKYDFDAGITGSRKLDCPKPTKTKKNSSKNQRENEGEER